MNLKAVIDRIFPFGTLRRADAVAAALEAAAEAKAQGRELSSAELERIARQHGYRPPEERARPHPRRPSAPTALPA